MAHHDGLPYEPESARPGVGSLPPLDIQLDMQQPDVGPPSPEREALATPAITPPDDEEEQALLAGFQREVVADWFGGSRA